MADGDVIFASIGTIRGNISNETLLCHDLSMVNHKHYFYNGGNFLSYTFPVLLLQITIIFFTYRLIHFVIKPLKQSIVTSHILAGIILGPSLLGHFIPATMPLFSLESLLNLRMFAHFGVIFHLFLTTLQMDTKIVWGSGKTAILIGIVSAISPALTGNLAYYIMKREKVSLFTNESIQIIFLAHSMSAFPAIISLLSDLKILNSELGRFVSKAAMINNMFCFAVFESILRFALYPPIIATKFILCGVIFICAHIFMLRPIILWLTRNIKHGETLKLSSFSTIILILLSSTFIGEVIGQSFVLGPILLGLVLPDNEALVEEFETKLDVFFNGILLPIFCAISGLNTNFTIKNGKSTRLVELMVVLSHVSKFIGAIIPALFCGITFIEALCMALVMCTKGVIDVVGYLHMKESEAISEEYFNILMITMLVIKGLCRPLVAFLYDPTKRYATWRRKTLALSSHSRQLGVLVCIHNPENVISILNLLEAFNPKISSPIVVIAMHLKKVTGKSSAAVLSVLKRSYSLEKGSTDGYRSTHSINAFNKFEYKYKGSTIVHHYSVSAPYRSMHVDVCTIGLDKKVNIIIIPFHKQWSVDGKVGSISPSIRLVNYNVSEQAPCTVGILIDRGTLNGNSIELACNLCFRVGVIYSGGDDDLEALALSGRLVENVYVTLVVIVLRNPPSFNDHVNDNHFKSLNRTTENMDRIQFDEYIVSNGEEATQVIQSKEKNLDLLILGRHHHHDSTFASGLGEWKECPELGLIGDMLSSSYFSASVLVVVQQRLKENMVGLSLGHFNSGKSLESEAALISDS